MVFTMESAEGLDMASVVAVLKEEWERLLKINDLLEVKKEQSYSLSNDFSIFVLPFQYNLHNIIKPRI